MARYVKDPEADQLAGRLDVLHRISKTEAVRRAVIHELESEQAFPSLVERGVAFTRALRARARPEAVGQADKAFIDGLYGDN